MKTNKENKNPAKTLDSIIKNLIDEYGNIFFEEINNDIYIYKPLGRKAFKDISLNDNLSELEKEDLVCNECILYPEDFDSDEVDAGIPSMLYSQILTNSYLTGTEQMLSLIEACRSEVEQLDIQMSCIISEAFPSYDMDEIEEWDMIKFCRMFGRAEWKLKNLRNFEFENDVVEFLRDYSLPTDESTTQEDSTNNKEHNTNNSNDKVKVGNREMTREEYRQYLDFQRAHPEINFEADTMYTGFDTMGFNDMPVALRPRNKI